MIRENMNINKKKLQKSRLIIKCRETKFIFKRNISIIVDKKLKNLLVVGVHNGSKAIVVLNVNISFIIKKKLT